MKITGKLHVVYSLAISVEIDAGQALFWNPQGGKCEDGKTQLEKVSRTLNTTGRTKRE